MYKRLTPYTEIGIRRLKCFRCGNKAKQQWQICSDGNVYRPVCSQCDVALNILVMDFMNMPDRIEKIRIYRESML